ASVLRVLQALFDRLLETPMFEVDLVGKIGQVGRGQFTHRCLPLWEGPAPSPGFPGPGDAFRPKVYPSWSKWPRRGKDSCALFFAPWLFLRDGSFVGLPLRQA